MNVSAVIAAARDAQRALRTWLVDSAYPLWSSAGVDRLSGAFVECLNQHGAAPDLPRRARVPPRQVHAFAQARLLGWPVDARVVAAKGMRRFIEQYRRSDGLYRTLVAGNGSPVDDSVLLYDQAFALLGFAAAHQLAGGDEPWPGFAEELLRAVRRNLKRPGPGFDSGLRDRVPLLTNAHMHLFESALTWAAISANPAWKELADEIGTLALERFIDPLTGVLRERFDDTWSPIPGTAGRLVEPGHQFEWAWLLLRWDPVPRSSTRAAAFSLLEIGERAGVQHGVVIDGLLDDLSVYDAGARLWPQTERLKAQALAASLTGSATHWAAAVAAADALWRYLQTPTPGLWHDRLSADGTFLAGPAPAGNLYHIVGAIVALSHALGAQAA